MKPEPSLVDAMDSILIIIDVQDKFLQRLDESIASEVLEKIEWLARVAKWLDLPTIVTAEEIEVMGPTSESIRRRLTDESPDLNKVVFGLAGQANILQSVNATGKRTAVLVGLETDVCVLQSAFGLVAEGYRVVVVSDACASPQNGHEYGLARLRDAGVTLVSTKGLFFEWVRDLEKCHAFFRSSGIGTPDSLYIG